MTRGAPLLQVSGLSKRFGKAGPAGLRDIGFSLEAMNPPDLKPN